MREESILPSPPCDVFLCLSLAFLATPKAIKHAQKFLCGMEEAARKLGVRGQRRLFAQKLGQNGKRKRPFVARERGRESRLKGSLLSQSPVNVALPVIKWDI